MRLIGRAVWKIEIRSGDAPQSKYPEWLELRGYGKRFQYVEREEAEREIEKLRSVQPHGQFRVAPM